MPCSELKATRPGIGGAYSPFLLCTQVLLFTRVQEGKGIAGIRTTLGKGMVVERSQYHQIPSRVVQCTRLRP